MNEEIEPILVRVCSIVSANCTITLKSNTDKENMDFLITRGLGVIASIDDESTMNTIKRAVREDTEKLYKKTKEETKDGNK